MKQQIVRTCPRTGVLIHEYVDHGPSKAVAGHGRPLGAITTVSTKPHLNISVGGGGKQMRLIGSS
jgi:hypothetical protein